MFNRSNDVDAVKPEPQQENSEPFTWTTPIRYDPHLVMRLRHDNIELRTLFSVAVQTCRDGAFDAAAQSLSNCMRKLRDVQRLEALRFYPVLVHHVAADSNASATVTYLRNSTHTFARRFLRLAEDLIAACGTRHRDEAVLSEASSALENYIRTKETKLYTAYHVAAAL